MSSKDISRFVFQPRKRYTGVRMQQGRVILDSDWNESERIDDEEARRTLIDLVCSRGTANHGFLVAQPSEATVTLPTGESVQAYDFALGQGSFYLGGLRFESEPETFLSQSDWLQIDAVAGNLPTAPTDLSPGEVRHDLVYLRGWEQCVTAVEDSELREVALGGPDTSVRIRRMRRVEVLSDVRAETCAAAFNALKAALTAADPAPVHAFDDANCELRSKARLTVVPDAPGSTDDPCKPAVPGGYLGADNQTIRVQLTAPNRFIWSYDNAAPLYRVQVKDSAAGPRRQIAFLTRPRDQAAQPLAGQAVEIIPWGALLPNREKVAELQGTWFTVATSYDPEDDSLTLAEAVPEAWLQWLADHPDFWSDRDPPERQQYFYLRLWTGASGEADSPDQGFVPGTPVALPGTGLSLSFSDHGLPGDYWVIAARPNTPKLVVPWELLEAAPPAGPRLFFAPLALIRWRRDAAGQLQGRVEDCRERFRPLCEIRGCCTVTVGDGVSSHGLFDAIEEAVDHLPAEGGEVCLLPGLHEANVRIVGRRHITLRGCGKHTRVIPGPSSREDPVFQVIDSQGIRLQSMDIATFGGTAILLQGFDAGALSEIVVRDNRILAYRHAIQVERGTEIRIQHNTIRMLDKQGAGVAILMLAEDGRIEGNDIGVVPAERVPPPEVPEREVPDPADPCADLERVYGRASFVMAYFHRLFTVLVGRLPAAPFRALGGIQIAAASERIGILDNRISGGAGNGITLGGVIPDMLEPPEEGQAERLIESTGSSIQGHVVLAGAGLNGIVLVFTAADGTATTTESYGDGYFIVPAQPGQYAVSIASPDLEIEDIAVVDDVELGRFHTITLLRAQRAPDESLAFLYEIQIDRNEISNMGLSGIGLPHPAVPNLAVGTTTTVARRNQAFAQFLALLGHPIVTLGIHRNHIHDCLRNPFDGALREEARRRGLGGISLGFCEALTLSGNRIERNGSNPINPACGVFIRFGEKVDMHHNLVAENAPLAPNVELELEPGIRGGIVMAVASFGIDDVFFSRDGFFDAGRHAGRIHDNIVHQPAGQALRVVAVGPLSICHNRFETGRPGPAALERLATTLLVLNAGDGRNLPEGATLFNGNQSRLGMAIESFTSQLLWTVDDLGFDANQSSALAGLMTPFINTVLLGRTLRASDSRFKEAAEQERGSRISLLSLANLINNTTNNQGDHCIFAFGPAVVAAGNQVLDDTLCPASHGIVAGPVGRFDVVARV
jgi:hypothetical protein